ncbi:MAG: hypothetical protein P8165_14445 [Deltaproteobacteria bacterium]
MDTELNDLLVEAIWWVGRWSWWNSDLPKSFFVEFSATQIWNPPMKDGMPPNHQIGFHFLDPHCVCFIERYEGARPNWPELLHNDKVKQPLNFHDPTITFLDTTLIHQLLSEVINIRVYSGSDPRDVDWDKANAKLVFWAGSLGLAIAADEMRIANHSGLVNSEQVYEMRRKYSDYYRDYWLYKTATRFHPNLFPFPIDYVCEASIPGAGRGELPDDDPIWDKIRQEDQRLTNRIKRFLSRLVGRH